MQRHGSWWTVWSLVAVGVFLPARAEEPVLRRLPCPTSNATELAEWQDSARVTLAVLLKMDDQIAANRHDG